MLQATPIRLTPSSLPLACSAYPFVDCSDWIRINTLPSPAELKRGRQCTVGRHHDEPDIILFEDRFPSRPDFDDSGVTFQNILPRSEEHTSELQSLRHLVCRLLLEKKNTKKRNDIAI